MRLLPTDRGKKTYDMNNKQVPILVFMFALVAITLGLMGTVQSPRFISGFSE